MRMELEKSDNKKEEQFAMNPIEKNGEKSNVMIEKEKMPGKNIN